MSESEKSRLIRPILRLGLAAAIVIASFLLRQILVLGLGLELPTFILFYPAVMVAAVLYGLWPGLLATALASVLVAYWFFPPVGQFKAGSASESIALALFSAMGIFMSVVAERHRQDQRRIAGFESEKALRKAAEKLQLASEAQRLAVEAANLGTWNYQLETGDVFWDETCRKSFGFNTGERIEYEAAIERIHFEDRLAVDDAVKAAIAGANGGAYHTEFRVVWPDGSIHWVASHGRVNFDGEDGNRRATRFIGVNAEITERKNAEEALHHSEEQFRNLANAIPQLCWMANADGWIFWYNDRWHHYTGATPEEMEGWGWQSVLDADALPKVMERWKESIVTGQPLDMVFPMRGADGVFRPFLTRVMPFHDADGNVIRWFGTNTDISEQKQTEAELRKSQERLNMALEVANLGEWERDLKANTAARSLRHAHIFGYKSLQSEWGLEKFLDHVLPEYRPEATRLLRASFSGEPIDFETQIRRVDGEVRWLWVRSKTEMDETGKPARAFGVVMDITERKQAEEALYATLQRFYSILSNLYSGVLLVTGEGHVEFANQAFCRLADLSVLPGNLVGLDSAEMIERMKDAYLHPDQAVARIREILDEGQPVMGEELPMRNGGTYLRDFVPLTVDGKSYGRMWVHTDISEIKRAEEGLRQQSDLLDLAHDTILVCDLDGIIRFWNHGAEEMYGYSKQQATGKIAHQLLRTVFPLPQDQIKLHLLQTGRWEGELAGTTQDGTGIMVASRWVLQRDRNDRPCGVMEINNDITARVRADEALRHAHQKLQSVLDSITDGLLVLDKDWCYTYLNEQGARMLGIRAEDRIGGCIWDFYPLAVTNKFGESYRRAVQTRQPVHFEEFYPEPLNKWLECHCYPSDEGLSVYFRDITGRRQAEEVIRASQEKLHGIVSSAMDAVISVDENQRIAVFNQAAEVIFQCPASEALGSTLDRFIPEQFRNNHREHIRRFGTEGVTSRSMTSPAILTAIRRNGEEFPIEATISHVEAAGQKLFTVILRDITERKRAEEQLQQLNRTLRALSNSTQALLRASDEQTFLIEVCRIVTEDCGHRMVWIGTADDDEYKTVRPLAVAGFEEGYLKAVRITWEDNERGRGPTGKAIRTGQPALCNNMLTDPVFSPWREEAGKRGYASSLVIPLKEGDNVWGIIGIYSGKPDAFSEGEVNLLTELAGDLMFGMQTLRTRAAHAQAEALAQSLLTTIQAEKERLTALVNSIKDEVWFVDTQKRFTLANPAARHEFGLSDSDERGDIGTFTASLEVLRADGTPRPAEQAPPLRALRGEVVKDELEVVRTPAFGELRYREVSSAPVNDATGMIVGAVSVVRDVTERIKAEQALLRSEKLASVGRMAAVIAHEINNPLAAVTNLLFLAQGISDLPEAARQYVEMADAELKRIAHITQQSLGFYRESNAPAIVPVNTLLDSALDLMKSRIKAKRAAIERELSGKMEVSAIAGELRQVFSNLLANSLDAIDEGGTIRLRARASYDFKNGRRCVRVTVADNGRGINATSRQHIFEPFFTTKGTVGTGLGLWVAKQIIDKHSGTIQMHSRTTGAQRGTVFSVVLPVDPAKEPLRESI